MRIINLILFYTLFSSSVLVYGIGPLRAAETSLSRKNMLLSAFKSAACVLSSLSLTYIIIKLLLSPLGLTELFPLVALLLFIALGIFFEIIIQLTSKKTASEFAVSYLIIILALNEGENLAEAVLISIACLLSHYMLIPLLFSFTRKMAGAKNTDNFRQKTSVFLCLVILSIALYALNISWINAGGAK